ncbi:phosphatase [Aureimonas sp. SA4125]|uniref:metallophosphoesterase n=1 Tax=Aureimonas sp. SA4125 TaxID=2826993 RepID=UPI001CC39C4B|nr:metallophosphoesterase [Aureimonas sp. SA4125]BDA85424.1 phosphatase [Aureimonas sp. SA4125]
MKIWIISDLHLGRHEDDIDLDIPDADVCVCAGDVYQPLLGSLRLLGTRVARRMPVVFVAGNHEFYGDEFVRARALAKATPVPGVHLLDDDTVTIDGVRFVGATLWTDYALYAGGLSAKAADVEIANAMEVAGRLINDHSRIRVGSDGAARWWTPSDARRVHQRSRAYIEGELALPFDGATVVVTHHAPHAGSIAPQYRESVLNPAFASDLSSTIETGRPALWVHGHVHSACDYRVGDTRVICNPCGYRHEYSGWDPRLVVEVGT